MQLPPVRDEPVASRTHPCRATELPVPLVLFRTPASQDSARLPSQAARRQVDIGVIARTGAQDRCLHEPSVVSGLERNWRYVSCREFIHGDHWPVDDAGEQLGLLGLEVCSRPRTWSRLINSDLYSARQAVAWICCSGDERRAPIGGCFRFLRR